MNSIPPSQKLKKENSKAGISGADDRKERENGKKNTKEKDNADNSLNLAG